jgi:hypothetical protein
VAGRSGTISFSDSGFPRASRTASAISSMDASIAAAHVVGLPDPTPLEHGSMARQWSTTCSHSRRFLVEAYSGRGWSSRARAAKSGMTFSGNW